jgi:hypothetical protein
MRKTAIAAAVVVAALLSVVSTAGAAKKDPPCSINPGSVSSGQSYTVSVAGLPARNVNLVVTAPDGATLTSWIDTAGGSYSGSYTAAFWNGETGTYKYEFVGKVSWPAGTYSQVYSTCSVQVS